MDKKTKRKKRNEKQKDVMQAVGVCVEWKRRLGTHIGVRNGILSLNCVGLWKERKIEDTQSAP